LSRPINVYSIPPDLLELLTVRSTRSGGAEVITPTADDQDEDQQYKHKGSKEDGVANDDTSEPQNTNTITNPGSSLTCQTCLNTSFPTLEDQRAHFKSDWHRYNAKVSMDNRNKNRGNGGNGKRGVLTAEEFEEIDDGESRWQFANRTSGRRGTS
jgi:hypothetical protein